MAVLLKENPTLTLPSTEDFASLSGPQASHGQVLLPDSHSGNEAALNYLREAHTSSLIRITGAGILAPQDSRALENLFANAFTGRFSGMVLTGATQSLELDTAKVQRGVMEAGARLELTCSDARVLGVVPTQRLKQHYDGSYSIDREQTIEIGLHPDNKMILSSAEKTPYIWDAEWRRCLELKRELSPEASLLISYSGGIATEREIRAWAAESKRDSSTHVALLIGDNSSSATTRLARNPGFLMEHPNVHLIQFHAAELSKLAADIGAISKLRRSST